MLYFSILHLTKTYSAHHGYYNSRNDDSVAIEAQVRFEMSKYHDYDTDLVCLIPLDVYSWSQLEKSWFSDYILTSIQTPRYVLKPYMR